MLHCDPRRGCVQKPRSHGTCGCHGNCNTQRLQRSLCFIKWLQGMAKRTWASWHEGCSITFWFIRQASCWGDFVSFLFANGDKLLGTRLLCIPSQESVLFMDTPGAFITYERCSIRYIHEKADGCFRVPAFSVQSVHGLWLKTWSRVWQPNPDRLSVPVNNAFVSLTE